MPRLCKQKVGFLLSRHAIALTVVRHGRTAWNADGRFQGHTDVPLDEAGRVQAQALATYLASERFDRAICSDLGRARETAKIVLGDGGPALEVDPRWREMGFGTWEGLTWDEIAARYPELATSTPFGTPERGESFADVCARVRAALEDIAARAVDGTRVFIATHAGVLHALLHVALGETEATALGVRFAPGSVTRLALERTGSRLVDLNVVPPGCATAPRA